MNFIQKLVNFIHFHCFFTTAFTTETRKSNASKKKNIFAKIDIGPTTSENAMIPDMDVIVLNDKIHLIIRFGINR